MRQTPYDEIVAVLASRLGSRCRLLPSKWEKIGSVLVLRFPSELHAETEVICRAYAEVLGCTSVLNDVGGIAGQLRVPQIRHLWGSPDTVTVHYENGVRYRLDPSKVMFSSGNTAERIRMGSVAEKGETVVDLFAGIGYFSLPLGVSHKPARVFACEINPVAFEFLSQNVVLNHVPDIVVPLLGDNRVVAPQGVANRVIMGYLEETASFFPIALRCLKDQCGFVHYHEAVPIELCPDRPLQALTAIAHDHERDLRLVSWREIKSYAPGVSHIVLDLEVKRHG